MKNEIKSVQVSLIQLLTDKEIQNIVVPIIQRDYAQGRLEEKEIRTHFLQQLKSYIEDPNQDSHDLDFVYGNINTDKEFIPLDGQQRLTTLFLLHYYLSIHDECFDAFQFVFRTQAGDSRFQYQTRLSSTDFCNELVNNKIEIINDSKISKNIQEKYPWFSDSWKYDPTIVSMLNMLDAIHTYFSGTKGLYQRLADVHSPAITFQVLYMSENGLTDDLYIKMNSRGLELTPFENLKAHIIKRLKNFDLKYKLVRSETKGEEEVSMKDYFAFKIDINWAKLFWKYRKSINRKTDDGQEYSIYDYDTGFLNFINTLVLNYKALLPKSTLSNDDLTKYNELYWSYYSNVEDQFYEELIDILDIFEQDALTDSNTAGIRDRLEGRSKFKICTTFHNFINKNYGDAAYDEHIRLYAYYGYLLKHAENIEIDDFYQWMRIVMNLTSNHTWQSVEDFCRSMKTIKDLNDKNKEGILNLLAKTDPETLVGFNPVQVKEECIKACLLLRSEENDWKTVIEDAEKIEYLKGQIISILNFSGIENYYDENGRRCDWNFEENDTYINSIRKYSDLYPFVFDENGLRPEIDGKKQLFRRALLAQGDYLIGISSNRWSLLINAHRDYSWHRYLQDNHEDRRSYFQQLLDGFQKGTSFESYLDDVIKKYTTTDSYDWRNPLIKEERIWEDFGNDYLLRFENNDNDIYILSTKTMGGWHTELRSRYLFYKLLEPCQVEYEYSQSWEYPYLYKKNDDLLISILYDENQWQIMIEAYQENYKYTAQQLQYLETHSFTKDNSGAYLCYKKKIGTKYVSDLIKNIL